MQSILLLSRRMASTRRAQAGVVTVPSGLRTGASTPIGVMGHPERQRAAAWPWGPIESACRGLRPAPGPHATPQRLHGGRRAPGFGFARRRACCHRAPAPGGFGGCDTGEVISDLRREYQVAGGYLAAVRGCVDNLQRLGLDRAWADEMRASIEHTASVLADGLAAAERSPAPDPSNGDADGAGGPSSPHK